MLFGAQLGVKCKPSASRGIVADILLLLSDVEDVEHINARRRKAVVICADTRWDVEKRMPWRRSPNELSCRFFASSMSRWLAFVERPTPLLSAFAPRIV
jgi:hypothetical protein